MASTDYSILAFQSRFKQLGIREDNAELVVQLMKQTPKIVEILFHRKRYLPCVWNRERNIARQIGLDLNVLRHGHLSPRTVTSVCIRFTPECVGENTDRTACGSNVFNFPTGNPVVDCPTTHTNQFASFHDRNCFSVNNHRSTLYLQTENFKFNKGKGTNTTSTRPRIGYRHGVT